MNHIYVLLLIAVAVLSSVSTVIYLKRKVITHKWVAYKSKRNNQLKEQVRAIVLEYLNELRNGEIDDITE